MTHRRREYRSRRERINDWFIRSGYDLLWFLVGPVVVILAAFIAYWALNGM